MCGLHILVQWSFCSYPGTDYTSFAE
jgi:hypothetical protein